MTDSERQQVLKMIDEGKISAEEGLRLLQALSLEPEPDSPPVPEEEPLPADFSPDPEPAPSDPQLESIKRSVRRLYLLPLALGIGLTAWIGWLISRSFGAGSGLGLLFYCLQLPTLALGLLLILLGASSQSSRWIYVDLRQSKEKGPRQITFGLPLNLVRWLVNAVQGVIPAKEREMTQTMLQALDESTREEPVILHVEDKDDERVRVYIG